MDLKHVVSFIAVAERGSFVQAATQLHLSQPGVTAHIQKLEADLNVTLFNREQRKVRLTKAGEAFLESAYRLIAAADDAAEAARRAASREGRGLRLAFPPSVSRHILPGMLVEIYKQFPDIQLELLSQHTSVTLSALQREAVDIGLVRLPVRQKGIRVLPVHQEPLVICLSAKHVLAKSKDVQIGDLREEALILYGRRWAPGFHDRILSMCQQEGFSPRISNEIDEMYVAPALVAAGEGIAILPRMVVTNLPEGVLMRKLGGQSYSEIGIATRSGPPTELVRSVIAIARSVGRQFSMTGGGESSRR